LKAVGEVESGPRLWNYAAFLTGALFFATFADFAFVPAR
jgi:hypothetical protein